MYIWADKNLMSLKLLTFQEVIQQRARQIELSTESILFRITGALQSRTLGRRPAAPKVAYR